MSVLQPLPPEDAYAIVVVMLTPSQAVDLFIGDLTRKSRSKSGRTAHSYRAVLDKFAAQLESGGRKTDVQNISSDECRVFLDNYLRRSQNYQALVYSIMNSFFTWLVKQERIRKNPLLQVERPLRAPAVDLDVVTIETNDVPLLFQACRTESERLTIAMLAYMGPRRNAVALLRRKHYNREAGLLSFEEKGTKAITKPVPDELRVLLDRAIDSGLIVGPEDYLIPPEGSRRSRPAPASAAPCMRSARPSRPTTSRARARRVSSPSRP
jgi:site-specific recombinase XerD